MSFPILYAPSTMDFDNNGIGILSDCSSCFVTEERNGAFDLVMDYPTDGIHFEEITYDCIIKAQLEIGRKPQLFRVYYINKPMFGVVNIKANHISYDLSGITIKPFSALDLGQTMQSLKTNVPSAAYSDEDAAKWAGRFSFVFDESMQTSYKDFVLKVPASIRSVLGGLETNILSTYGGEFEFDNFDVVLHKERGKDNGVSIAYGKNLTNLQQEINCSSYATAVYPFWAKEEENGEITLVSIGETVQVTETEHRDIWFRKVIPLDLTEEFDEQPSVEELSAAADVYILENNIGKPSVSLSLTYSQLQQTEEYRDGQILDRVMLCDMVYVKFPALGVSTKAKVTKIVYDVLRERVDSAVVGSVKMDIADTISSQGKAIDSLKKSVRK